MLKKKRYEIIRPEHVDLVFLVHTGSSYKQIKISTSQVGRKFGEFAHSKVPAQYKKHGKKH